MFVIDNLGFAILFCVITMLGWGSWGNTQKMAGKDHWPFALFYWDYVLGILLLAILLAATLGSFGSFGASTANNLRQAAAGPVFHAILSGALFNASNLMLVAAIDAAGMSVAFPIGVGLALVIGTVTSYLQSPKGNSGLLFGGLLLIVLAMVFSAVAHGRLPASRGRRGARGIVFAVIAGSVMGLFYPQLARAVSPQFNTMPCQPGLLTPYPALLLFAVGVFASNFVVGMIALKAAGVPFHDYFAGSKRLHSLGILGGMIWMVALSANLLASAVAGPAISYALGQGATLVAAIWGVFVWHEFRHAPAGTTRYVVLMFVGYAAGLILIGTATL